MSILSAIAVVVVLAGIVVIGLLAIAGYIILIPIASNTAQRMKLEREAGDAAWEIHRRATQTISQMLSEAVEEGGSDGD